MADRYGIRSRFETDGVFWDVKNPETRFSAHLRSAGHIELSVSAELSGPERLFSDLSTTPARLDILLGIAVEIGLCTLIGLHELPGDSHFVGNTGQVVFSRRYRVDACIIGFHLRSEDSAALTSAVFTYSGIDEWLPSTGQVAWTAESVSASYPIEPATLIDICILALRCRVRVVIAHIVRSTPGGSRFSSRTEPRIVFDSAEPRSLLWFIELAWRLGNFFSLCLGTTVDLRTLSVHTSTNENGFVIAHRRRKRTQKPDLQAWIRCDSVRLTHAIVAWLAEPDVFRPLEGVVYGAIYGSSLVAETEFLSLAQALESFHRLTDPRVEIPEELFGETKRVINSVIRFFFPFNTQTDEAVRRRISESISHADEPSFRTRLGRLIARVSPTTSEKLVGSDLHAFIETLVKTRNYFTHPGIKKASSVVTSAGDLFLFNQKMHALLRLLLLVYLGFSNADVGDQAQYQSRRWRIL